MQATNRKPKYIYKTAQEVIESGGSRKKKSIQPSELSKVKVIDMTGKEKRVLSGESFNLFALLHANRKRNILNSI